MSPRLFTTSLALAFSCLAIAACGSSHPKTQSAGASVGSGASSAAAATNVAAINPNDPALGEVLASVSGKPITRGQLLRWMEVGGATRQEGREPSSVLACIDQMRDVSIKTPGQLKGSCRERFQKSMESALGSLIHNQWILGEAAERGVKANAGELRAELEKSLGPPDSRLERKMLAQTGQSIAEVRSNLKLGQLSDRLYEEIEAKIPKLTQARLASYYERHKQQYAVPLQRDLHIIRFATDASARKALGELRSGESFQSVAKKVPIVQPIGTEHALLLGLSRHGFSQPTLINAIYRARPGTIVGPVRIFLGYYDFEVIRIHQPRQRTLSEVRPKLEKELPELLHSQTLAAAVKAFKEKWVARTSCTEGWIVENCRQYKVSKGSESYDAYTL